MFKDRFVSTLFFINLLLIAIQVILIILNFNGLPQYLPLLLTNPWGQSQLTDKYLIWLLPAASAALLFTNSRLNLEILKKNEVVGAFSLAGLTAFLILILTTGLYRIVFTMTSPQTVWLVKPAVILTLSLSFTGAALLTWPALKLAQKFGLIDNPKTHKHPAMLLTRSVARAGALPIFLSVIATTQIISGWNQKTFYIILAALIAVATGLADDKYDLNPHLRFGLQILCALVVTLAGGLQIDYINHPLGRGVLPLTSPVLPISPTFSIQPLALVLALFWIIWTMNMISWSNGVDGQFPLIVAIAASVIGILGLNDVNQFKTSTMAFAVAGAALGTLPFSWHPAKILYGFGATGIGLILASLSILNGTKIATAFLVLLVPSLDAIFTILRRIRSGRSAFWGDRAHLHHKFLDLGFSQKQISLFYGLVGLVLGTLAIISSGRGKMLALAMGAGVVIFIISLVNYAPSSEGEEQKTS